MMRRNLKRIDINTISDLRSLAEEVRTTKEPRVLRRDSEDIAILMPITSPIRRKAKHHKTKADYAAFHSAAGGWKDVDTDTLIKNIYEDRRMSNRPPVEL
jgi:hypothetical protein